MPNQAVLDKIDERLRLRTRRRAREGNRLNQLLHRNAQRGGGGTNRFGEPTSTPGGPPAPDSGRLFALIEQSLRETRPNAWEWVTNYAVMEFGSATATRIVLPRPLGRITVAEMKARAGAGR